MRFLTIILLAAFALANAKSVSITVQQDSAMTALQKAIDAKTKALYGDRDFRKAARYEVQDQLDYLDHLLKYKVKDTAAVLTFASERSELLDLEKQQLEHILDTQDDNNRYMIRQHIRATQRQMAAVADYITRLSSDNGTNVIHHEKQSLNLE
jgi:hypothetical protein